MEEHHVGTMRYNFSLALVQVHRDFDSFLLTNLLWALPMLIMNLSSNSSLSLLQLFYLKKSVVYMIVIRIVLDWVV